MQQPNIVFIFMDDMGWRDLGCSGSTFYETPNIDQMCREGMRFDCAYAACPVCSPSRASFLSGQYPARIGVTDWIDESGTFHPLRGKLIDAPYFEAYAGKYDYGGGKIEKCRLSDLACGQVAFGGRKLPS